MERHASNVIRRGPEKTDGAYPSRFRVITSTKWEVNMTRKYRVASSTMVPKMPGTLGPTVFDFFAKKMINKNARESDLCALSARSAQWSEVQKHAHAP